MLPTEMYFYDNVYAKQIEADIVEYGEDEKFGPFLVFNRTIFHPHGGGQKGDRGKVILHKQPLDGSPAELNIIDTRGEKGGVIKHVIDLRLGDVAGSELPNTPVTLQLNWGFRYTQMRLHSSSHLIHMFMEQLAGQRLPQPRISDILEDYGLNVYDSVLDIKPEDMPKVVSAMNEFMNTGHEITTYPDLDKPTFRYWRCKDVTIPCGGTHPHTTSEVGPISASLSVKKGKTKVLFRLA
jgi:Ser-tRNA(Ala) deacylase AlaX